ncbi:pyridoxamine 5'-phosphate oxidase family protein [Shewanella sp. 202IG2-18]|uniref:pyridoxamine 5'-phosphate oxidase family protein n=1 Tax=Parashewanella hymeniacidonis TaxID=2807618 RepID=UPI0019608BEE|nr:pyridoxamine 5'-phosphate oxidase family protein [Parashewanella hymeniacidonis]MBM7072868.1 pyridoxamine 5'-phosphate oxidase family protein [Parashewanella hymeniacidonis]
MGKLLTSINKVQREFIENQKMFFVATAAPEGTVNLSPKGMDSLKVIDENTVAWLNVTGSGNETSAHVQQNHRMTIMFCAFKDKPLILRLYGQARAVHQADSQWSDLYGLFEPLAGARQIFVVKVEHTQSSCGMGVPLFDFVGQREDLNQSHQRKSKRQIEDYWKKANQQSIDGYDTNILSLSGLDQNQG